MEASHGAGEKELKVMVRLLFFEIEMRVWCG